MGIDVGIGSVFDTASGGHPVLDAYGNLEDDLNGDGIVDLYIWSELFITLNAAEDDLLGTSIRVDYSGYLVDTDFDGKADIQVGTGLQPLSAERYLGASQIETDRNNDGSADLWAMWGEFACYSLRLDDDGDVVWTVFSTAPGIEARDEDYDGQIDRWITTRTLQSIDNDGDGVIETWVTSGAKDEYDTDGDGTADLRLSRSEDIYLDEDGNGMIELVYHLGDKIETLTETGWELLQQAEASFEIVNLGPESYLQYLW